MKLPFDQPPKKMKTKGKNMPENYQCPFCEKKYDKTGLDRHLTLGLCQAIRTKSAEPKSEIDHEYTENVVCPYCGWEDTDSQEIDFGSGSDETTELDCGECGEIFIAHRIVTVDYSTEKKGK